MAVRPGSFVWERTDNDGWCNHKWVASDDYYFEVAGRSDETLNIMEADLKKGAGYWLTEGDQKFHVEKVIWDIDQPDVPIRVISPECPPFGEWRKVDAE
ncbi:hypothetical protein [Nocardia neocaledoniensis]|uniref:hypothetical protein n=1 Tax=Nocardia neocaledoniensis TaxID=236511 RepID=UPI0024541ED1|nr:hypothetical protein [Nocardia neocaledoniensis]